MRASGTGTAESQHRRGQRLHVLGELHHIVGRHGAADDRLVDDLEAGNVSRRHDFTGQGLAWPAFEVGTIDDDAAKTGIGYRLHVFRSQLGSNREIFGECIDGDRHGDLRMYILETT